jgi:predicted NBD/HSP70 family sugar kinase
MLIESIPNLNDRNRAPADAHRVRAYNAGILLNSIWNASGGTSRADLSRQTGLSRSTVSAIVSDLINAELIAETHTAKARSGRPPIVLAFRDEAFGLIGVEMGASHITVVLCNARGTVLFHKQQDWDIQGDPAGTIKLMNLFISEARQAEPLRRIIGIGLAAPCPLDSTDPKGLSRHILPAWTGIDVQKVLADEHQVQVFVDNDANLGALAEAWWGAARDTTCATYIKVATGVGAGHVINGRLFRGSTGIAGEIGHTTVAFEGGNKCRCSLYGCLEAEIGSGAIIQRANQGILDGKSTVLQRGPGLTLTALVDAAISGDHFAENIIAQAGQYLGVAIANLLNLMNPSRVIIGGSLAEAGDLLLDPLKRAIKGRALWSSIERADVVLSELGDKQVAVGAATLVLENALALPSHFSSDQHAMRAASI